MHLSSQIIRNVRLTEKASLLTESLNKYVFEVAVHANKIEIRKAIEELFGKKVVSVNTSNHYGKARRKRTAAAGHTADWKKAVVTLAAGETLELA
ncbi:MAG: 50S ribosomal protein L23 [Verrucomicrobiota bacterium]|jgi:large subunit ribosomal protein L23|nr:50S ribosomal protein L23 [Chthoniobacteraceae bacterium]NBV32269.1 50S ribosomal protein L23 [Pseudomonadota bacterium]